MTPETESQLNSSWMGLLAENKRLREENAELRRMVGDDPRRTVKIVQGEPAPADGPSEPAAEQPAGE